jgi:hypothetical protein
MDALPIDFMDLRDIRKGKSASIVVVANFLDIFYSCCLPVHALNALQLQGSRDRELFHASIWTSGGQQEYWISCVCICSESRPRQSLRIWHPAYKLQPEKGAEPRKFGAICSRQ